MHGNTTHGHCGASDSDKSRTYRAWQNMKQRCLNPRAKNYSRYGGRGVVVCESWMTFDGFLKDLGVCPPGLTLDRLTNKKGYEPSNCRWATRAQQYHSGHR